MHEIQAVMDTAVRALRDVPGVKAIVLGGSRARGTHGPGSDVDIGIYYGETLLDVPALDRAAASVDDAHRENLIAAPGRWGNWVNGGAWLTVGGYPVDFILRDMARVKKVIAQCEEGIVTRHYQPGHPHAYINVMYRGELAVSQMLWDADGSVAEWKRRAEEYPARLKEALTGMFLSEAAFSHMLAGKSAGKDDVYYRDYSTSQKARKPMENERKPWHNSAKEKQETTQNPCTRSLKCTREEKAKSA